LGESKIDLYEATLKAFERYARILSNMGYEPFNKAEVDACHFNHLLWMCDECMRTILTEERWTIDKYNRWLGFVQGVLASKGVIDVNEERDITREWFRGKENT